MRTSTHPRRHDGRANHSPRRQHDPYRAGGKSRPANGKPTALQRMLAQRDRLADKYYEQESHGYLGALDTAQLLGTTEDAIRNLSPATYRTLVAQWAEDDVQREHDPDDPRPATCPTCSYHADSNTSRASA